MIALGPDAFVVDAHFLLSTSQRVDVEETSDTLRDFAYDLATIQNLPETAPAAPAQ